MIVVAGEALVDLVIEPDGQVAAALGGAPFNAARAAARLGSSVQYFGALSTDRFGSLLLDQLVRDGVGVELAPRTDLPTTLAAAELDPSGGAEYRFYIAGTSAPQLTATDLRPLPDGPEAVFTGGLGVVLQPMADTILALVEGLPEESAVVVDVNCRPKVIEDRSAYLQRLWRMLLRTDVVKVSDEDLAYLLPGVDVASAARELLDRGPAAVVVTRGSTATFIATANGSVEVPVRPLAAPIVDTIGAGDTFAAALLVASAAHHQLRARLRSGRALADLADAVDAAHAASAVVVTRRGADPPWRHELRDIWAQ